MDTVLTEWLARIGWRAFSWALAGMLVLNAAAAIWFVLRGSRGLIQRWTSLWLAGNLVLLAIGIGVPATTSLARLVVMGVNRAVPSSLWVGLQTPAGDSR